MLVGRSDGKRDMELIGGPAALGGILLCAALCGWALGRWQGGLLPGAVPRAGRAAAGGAAEESAPPEPQERAEPASDDVVASLGALHAEITAYRRAEQVLRGPADEGLEIALSRAAAGTPVPPRGGGEAVQPSLAPSSALVRV